MYEGRGREKVGTEYQLVQGRQSHSNTADKVELSMVSQQTYTIVLVFPSPSSRAHTFTCLALRLVTQGNFYRAQLLLKTSTFIRNFHFYQRFLFSLNRVQKDNFILAHGG